MFVFPIELKLASSFEQITTRIPEMLELFKKLNKMKTKDFQIT